MATLQLNSVVKRFDETQVIQGVDLEVKDEEFVVFVGPSGCGKSTLLRMIAGLESTSSGISSSKASGSTTWGRRSAAWPWYSRAMPSIRT